MLSGLRLILDTIKFSHTLFALPFAAVAAVWAAGGWPGWAETALLLAAMVAARTCAMAANRVLDATIDAANPRTRNRAIPAGKLSRESVSALAVGAGLVVLAAAAAFWPLKDNPWPAILALPFLIVLCGYSLTKRFTALSHYVLGLALGLSPVGVWVALRGRADWLPVVLGGAVMLWTAGFDILYALQDMDHDRKVGLRSIPARLGAARALFIARINHLLAVALLLGPYWLAPASAGGPWYLAAVVLLGALLAYEHRLISPTDLRRLDRAFFTVNASASVVFAALAIVDVLT